jgi:hypothetical protein
MSSKKPGNTYPLEFPSQAVSFDPDAFNELIANQGVRLVHHKALRCPVGMTDVDDNRRPHSDHSGCSNGFIYFKAGIVTATLLGNSNNQQSNDIGLIESSQASSTFPQYYDNTDKPIEIAPFDRFYLDEIEPESRILVPTWHLQKVSESGLDKLYYPAETVEKLVDMRGEEYWCDEDFTIVKGCIKWSRSPGYQTDVGRGAIYSIRYSYRPFWYVTRLLHEIRVAQVETRDGRRLVRMPQQALLSREYVYTNEDNDRLAPDANSLRQVPPPSNTGWEPK